MKMCYGSVDVDVAAGSTKMEKSDRRLIHVIPNHFDLLQIFGLTESQSQSQSHFLSLI